MQTTSQINPIPSSSERQENPVSLLKSLSEQQLTGNLQVSCNGVNWSISLVQGQIAYITHNLEPLTRLIEQVQRLGVVRADQVRSLLNALFVEQLKVRDPGQVGYDALLWLLDHQHLTQEQGQQVCERLTYEALESFLLVTEGEAVFHKETLSQPPACAFDLNTLLNYGQERIRSWQALGTPICSTYQRLYITSQATSQRQLAELPQPLRALLRGLSFRNLAALTRSDELRLAQSLLPYIHEKVILLREPQPPFHQLPRLPALPIQPTVPQKPTCTIACVDDSPTITNEILRCLGGTSFQVVAVNDPLKALIQITRVKPELILLDVGMPLLDGYELCRLLRKNPLFKKTPIVMVTGNTGFFDRARATMAGATDYLTKPFTKEGLLKIVHRHLAP